MPDPTPLQLNIHCYFSMKTGETGDIYKKDIRTEYMRLLDYLGLQITTVAFTVRGCRG